MISAARKKISSGLAGGTMKSRYKPCSAMAYAVAVQWTRQLFELIRRTRLSTLRMGGEMQRNNGQISDTNVFCTIYLQRYIHQHLSVQGRSLRFTPHTLSWGSTTPPFDRGSIEREPAVSTAQQTFLESNWERLSEKLTVGRTDTTFHPIFEGIVRDCMTGIVGGCYTYLQSVHRSGR